MYKTAHPKRSNWLESGLEGVENIDDLGWNYEDFTFQGYDNVTLKGWIVKASKSPSGATPTSTFILIHGHKKNKIQMLGRGKLLHDLGYNLVFIDFRHHGDSEDGKFGLGYFGKFDLQKLVKKIQDSIFPASWIGVFGISLGATTALATEADFHCLDCIIADSPSSNQTATLCEYARRLYYAPYFMTKAGLYIMEKLYKMDFSRLNIPQMNKLTAENNQIKQNSQIKQNGPIEQNDHKCRILILHGKEDNRVPFYHAKLLFDSFSSLTNADIQTNADNHTNEVNMAENPDIKLITFNDSNHVQGYMHERERYDKAVTEFLCS